MIIAWPFTLKYSQIFRRAHFVEACDAIRLSASGSTGAAAPPLASLRSLSRRSRKSAYGSCQDRQYTIAAGARHPYPASRDRSRSACLATWQRCRASSHDDPGIGPVGATALAASITHPHQFRSGRQFAAWLGLTPLQKRAAAKSGSGASPKSAPRKTMPCEIPASQERSPALPCVGRVEVRRHFPVPKGVDGNSRSLPP
jgi:transposase IS116/IS110/IS902 family protein